MQPPTYRLPKLASSMSSTRPAAPVVGDLGDYVIAYALPN
jgi:hypothetical protein